MNDLRAMLGDRSTDVLRAATQAAHGDTPGHAGTPGGQE